MKRSAIALLALGTALTSAAPASAGFWESRPAARDGEAASIAVSRARGRTVVSAISVPTPDCRSLLTEVGAGPGPRLRVDRRGRFAARLDTLGGLRTVEGRLRRGPRPVATLRATWRRGTCREVSSYTLRPVRRVRPPGGRWTGTHAGGGAVSFEVGNAGRRAFGFELSPSPRFNCQDGSSGQIANYGLFSQAWIRPGGSFALREFVDNGRVFSISGTFSGAQVTGTLRVVEPLDDARVVCDTGPVAFSAAH